MKRTLLLFFLLLIAHYLVGQNLRIERTDSEVLGICGEALWQYDIENRSGDILEDIAVSVQFPNGIALILTTSSGWSEIDVSDLNRPVFSLDLLPGEMKRIAFSVEANCVIFDAVQMGERFVNEFSFLHPLFQQDFQDAPPFEVRTPFLVIQPINDTLFTSGTTTRRGVAITNTRLGRLSSFELLHEHDSLDIIPINGSVMANTFRETRVRFDSLDFILLGNLDAYLDPGETLVYEEDLRHELCDVEILASDITVSWGCGQLMCQEDMVTSSMVFLPTKGRARLRVQPSARFPECPCVPEQQCVRLTNFGDAVMDSLSFWFVVGSKNDRITGLDPGTIVLDSGMAVIDSITLDTTKPLLCDTARVFGSVATVYLSDLAPGQSIKLCFDYASCLERVRALDETLRINWSYGFRHRTLCRPDDLQRNPGVDVSIGTKTPLFAFSWEGDNVKLEPGTSYEARWEGSGEQLLDSGQIRLRLCYPCGISEEGPLRLDNGDTPVSETTVEIDGKVFRDFIFDLPFSNGSFIGRMPLSFSCEAPCLDSVPVSQRTQIVTSCPNVTSSTNNVKLGVCGEVFLAPCPGQSDCGYFILGETFARIECEKGPPRQDTVSGYVLLDGQGQRTSLGFLDDNDDRRVDVPMTTDQADVRRSIFGDTLVFDFAGEITVDFGPVLDSLVLKVQPGFDIEFISSNMRYVEAATGREWECNGLPGEVVMVPPTPGVCCEISFSQGGAEPLTGKVEVTQRILDMLPCDVEDFQVMDGDSFFFEMVVRNVHYRDIIERFDVNQKAEVYDSEVDELRFSCDAIVTPMLLTTSLFDLRSVGSGPLFVCDSFDLDYGWWIDPSAMTDNFFENEIRPLTRLDEVVFEVDQELEVRSMVILGIYRDSLLSDTLFQERHLPDTLIEDAYVFSFDHWDSLVIDEGIDVFIYPELFVRECQGIDSDVDISMSARIDAVGGHQFVVWPQLQDSWTSFTFSSTRLLRINRASLRADVGNTTITATEDSICLIIGVTVDDNLEQFDLYSLLDEDLGQTFDLRLPPGLNVLGQIDSLVTIVPDRSGDFIIEICYENSTCETQRAEAGLSWTCGGSQPCYDSLFIFQIVKTDGELEMEVFSMPQVIDVCDTSDWIEVEIFSADLGSVYDLELTLMRNLGLEIVESSVEVQYPIGSMWRPVALPVNFQGTDLTWELDEDVLGRRSLPGIQGAPFNVVRLRFKAIADCGISDGSFFSMVLRGRGPCGEPTNEVRGSSGLLNIVGLPSALRQTLEVTPEAGCGEEVILDIRLFSNDPSTGEEGLRILLDPPLEVRSVDGRHGISSSAPVVIDTQGARLLLFQPDQLLSGDSVHLVLTLGGADRFRCDSVLYDVTSTISATRFCPSKMADCEVNVVNAIQSGNVLIPGFGVNAEVLGFDAAENCLEVRLDLERFGLDTITEPLRFEIKVDDNGDGRSDPGEEVFLETLIGPEDLLKDSLCLAFDPRDICAFTMSYSGPCICSSDTFSLSLDRQLSDSIYLDTCLGEGLRIIPPAVPFDTLVWSGLVNCDTCGSIDLSALELEGRDTSILVLDIIRSPLCDFRLTYFIIPKEKENGLKEVVEVCMGDPVQLSSRFDQTQWISDSLVFEGNDYVFAPEMDMDILAISQNGERCSRPDTFCVRVQPLPELQVAPDDSTIFLGDTIGLEAIFSDGNLEWSPDDNLSCTSCPDPLAYPETTTTFIVKLTDAKGCMSLDSINLRVSARPCTDQEIFVPNAFSPNGDFINDQWRVRGKSIERLRVVVYNRWGELVFESTDPDFFWDGTFTGQALTTDVFAYAIEVDCVGGEQFFHKGNLSLIR